MEPDGGYVVTTGGGGADVSHLLKVDAARNLTALFQAPLGPAFVALTVDVETG